MAVRSRIGLLIGCGGGIAAPSHGWSGPWLREYSLWFCDSVALGLEDGSDLFRADSITCKTESTVLSHLARSAQECAKRTTIECAAHADPFDSDRREVSQAELNPAQTHHDAHGPIQGFNDGNNVIFARYAWSIQDIRARFLVPRPP